MMSYWVLFIGIAVASWLVQMNLQNKFKKYSKIPTGNGMTGRDVALTKGLLQCLTLFFFFPVGSGD